MKLKKKLSSLKNQLSVYMFYGGQREADFGVLVGNKLNQKYNVVSSNANSTLVYTIKRMVLRIREPL